MLKNCSIYKSYTDPYNVIILHIQPFAILGIVRSKDYLADMKLSDRKQSSFCWRLCISYDLISAAFRNCFNTEHRFVHDRSHVSIATDRFSLIYWTIINIVIVNIVLRDSIQLKKSLVKMIILYYSLLFIKI